MTLGEHIVLIRKRKKLSQSALGKMANTSGDLIGRYERDEVKPSIDVIMRLSEALNVSIDYLVGKTDFEVDMPTSKRMAAISKLADDDKNYIFNLIDILLRDFSTKQAYS
jgi:transcriptional regulator with XRE-family HTH domain